MYAFSSPTHTASQHNTQHRLGFILMTSSIVHIYREHPAWSKSDMVWRNIDMHGLGLAFKSLDTKAGMSSAWEDWGFGA